ncbi:ABC transporter ATP-binding protein [Aneurinibacillus sp. Ricciae_BoGa-3]|uniref:ABC transporter ATP-binding protein n=1 Tax=Aneurinibacillus sp. Ricciae_BoGa-3 TaxID=3022697 RepID=UPI00233FAAC4|nr:ABC transporter ATP-binding protein [Aneurinibacillus sp. Ricciae_BoGa-3]WCK54293.1 ABC transporter ATP-binding protein [Aneurinibacillus sp. Ricciae_BoGa-3]
MDNVSIDVESLTKAYRLYDRPIDRLKESLNPMRKSYHKEFYALNNISFTINKGDTVGIIGKNGSGKSTLLKIITGVLNPSSGSVKVKGKIAALLELGAGFNPEMTGMENIYLNGTIMGYSKEEMDEKLDDILSFADIGDFIYQPVKTYSSGMFVRLAFSVNVNVDPDILIVDEALAVGDMQFQLKCIEKMKSFKKMGKTILFVSHDTYSIRNFCTDCIWMKDGQIHMRGNAKLVTDEYQDFMKDGHGKKTEVTIEQNVRNDILTIDRIYTTDMEGNARSSFNYKENIKVVIDYSIHNPMKGIVGGVALFDRQDTYVCGLNTKLDQYPLPSEPGKYQLSVRYEDVSLLPGTYFIDVGFFESSGLVRLDYQSKAEQFVITSSDYLAEGMVCLKHHWHNNGGDR